MGLIETQSRNPFSQLTTEILPPLTATNGLVTIAFSEKANLINGEMVEAADTWAWTDETHHNSDLGISVASAFYGKHLVGPEQIFEAAKEKAMLSGLTVNVPDKTGSTGFDELYQLSPGLTVEQYMLTQQLVAKELVGNALGEQEIEPTDVGLFIVATSIPLCPDYADQIASACGISTNTEIVKVVMACNSSGWARAQVESGRFDYLISRRKPNYEQEGADILLFAIDDQNKYTDRGGDPLSPQFFSTGAAAMVWKYGSNADQPSFRQIAHTSLSLPAGMHCLALTQPYLDWGLTEKDHNFFIADHLSLPPEGKLLYMRERVGVSFVRGAIKVVEQTLAKYPHSVEKIKRIIAHHPSKGVFDLLVSKLSAFGFTTDQARWVISEGNVPVATMPMALGRQLNDLNPGDHVMFLTFGAGGGYTCSIDELGPRINN